MSDLYTIDPMLAKDAHIDRAHYKTLYHESIEQPEAFWNKVSQRLEWFKAPTKIKNVSYQLEDVHIRWFEDGELNASVNCLDRHLTLRGDKTALLFEPDAPDAPSSRITYRELYERVCQLGNALRHLGIEKGDRVTIYLPMIPDAVVAILACARIGAIHSVVFGGFAANSIADRVNDCGSKLIITADEGLRGGRKIPLKANVDAALKIHGTQSVETVLVVRHTGSTINMHTPRDRWFHDLVDIQATECAPERMNAEDSLFILYTSGSTGKPKGVLHTTGGYLVYTSYTHETVFDLRENDIYWCTADIGWITGHSYIVYGPLANGTTVLLFEGTPHYPTVSRFWEVIDKHHVTLFYTAPTAIRALMREGDTPVKKTSRKSLRLLGSVGEPINPEAWHWYYTIVGNGRCPIVDTWWQTETGGILITPLIGATDLKPGSVTLPFFGIRPALVDTNGQTLDGPAAGNLVLLDSWPGQMRTLYGDHQRFIDTYFRTYPNTYFTGDGCRRDADGYYWITGRVDDVINISGHRIGTAEIESTLVAHPKVAEAAVVGFPHPIKGQGIYAYVTLITGETPSEALHQELLTWVRKEIGAIAIPDHVQWASNLPKTRSGKIMRRILRKIAENAPDQLGDTSTLADPSIVDLLLNERLKH
ncbi:acetate--CoA ligase [Xylella fastidiosa subsp. fastidiosa]|jgi:acetyl-CoA synthetase|uniref:Acetyl-coenzyme A synthetase n=2 Tax=Xylella fastidiosa TaxID=2371 RepID=ACSA_XYLFT|nr:acetate--CoA ligase [Xylella fastidiosa]Q87C00.1 RecName: Full=Acetyl-coenzyme A synthetase; Short=AcCoA synthetase; Short=Acs; AltName: Full=Acetate--CoA ligase; AltName: Full=Acyl-activating enzyme [Xylella fastidiosa Temecula1]ADN62138.1 acetyl-CoA synthetase [Xylella fastidiosa subsp. fastidiosa GB514]KAF0570554.1 acetyl-CoA synthetase [Xylella fastidiosa subsp. fastidiosa Mus-1]AAO29145.1 acetyl coenzyme A synthetase [Xylella fastidiosa Temecula1]ACB92799.1 acetate--CoA ligase [Xylella